MEKSLFDLESKVTNFSIAFLLITRRIPDLLEILCLTSLRYMEVLKHSFTKQFSL